MVGSKDTLRIFFKGQVEHVLTMANLKLKPSLFTPPYYAYLITSHHIVSYSRAWFYVLFISTAQYSYSRAFVFLNSLGKQTTPAADLRFWQFLGLQPPWWQSSILNSEPLQITLFSNACVELSPNADRVGAAIAPGYPSILQITKAFLISQTESHT